MASGARIVKHSRTRVHAGSGAGEGIDWPEGAV